MGPTCPRPAARPGTRGLVARLSTGPPRPDTIQRRTHSPAGYADAAHYIGYHSYTLTPKSSFYLTAFLTTSLTDALARLAPDAQRTDFMKRGSFQYCFYVDNELVYTAYLQPEPQ